MNILPHKSWHVRTKKNIARVRKDEAQAAEEEKEKQRKIALAAQEARTALLRERAGQRLVSAASSASIDPSTEVAIPLAPVTDIVQQDGHVNFFQDVEEGKRQGGINEDAEDEKRKEQEDYEKKIGYLVYLGQDSIEQTKQKPWYANIDRSKGKDPEDFDKIKSFEKSGYLEGFSKDCKLTTEELKVEKFKNFQDPLKDIRRYLKTPGVSQKLNDQKGETSRRRKHEEPASLLQESSKPKKLKKEKKKKSKKPKKEKHYHRHHKTSKKHKKHSKQSSSSSKSEESSYEDDSEDERKRKNLEKLRAERLEREREEKRRTEQLLAKLRGEKIPEDSDGNGNEMKGKSEHSSSSGSGRVKQRYNSQFNPELARQNYDFR